MCDTSRRLGLRRLRLGVHGTLDPRLRERLAERRLLIGHGLERLVEVQAGLHWSHVWRREGSGRAQGGPACSSSPSTPSSSCVV